MNNFDCGQAAPLIPAWADGELSEAQSAPLREHLLACRDCRGSMQELRALSRWFVGDSAAAVAVPPGFAARVARRAFAGDTGERSGAPAIEQLAERRRTLDFVLGLTAVAAAAVIALALGLRARELPRGENLHADDRTQLSTEQILERLDALDLPTELSLPAPDTVGETPPGTERQP